MRVRKINAKGLTAVLILTGLILAIMATPAFAAVEQLYIIDTVVGNGSQGYSGDGGLATGAELHYPCGVAVDSSGNIYFSDRSNNVVREVAATNHAQFGISMTAGDIYTVAGNGSTGGSLGDGGPATSAELHYPCGVAVDSSGDLFISDTSNNRVREVANTTGPILGTTTAMTAGDIYAVAGNGSTGGSLGDGGPAASAELNEPSAVAFDSSGNLYIADRLNNAIREVANTTGNEFGTTTGSMTIGDIYTAVGANLPIGIAFDGNGNLYMIEANENEVIEAANTTNDEFGTKTPMTIGDSYVVASGLNDPSGITFCGGTMCIANTGQDDILEDIGGTITGVAGNGGAGYYGDGFGGNGTEGAITAALNGPCGIAACSSSGNLYITDCNNNVIRELSTDDGSFQVPFLTASAAPGTVGGTTEVTASPNSYAGDTLTVDVSTSWIADPQVGVAVPTGSGVISEIDNYAGGNINAVAGDYVQVFEMNNGGIYHGGIAAFNQIQLTNDDILPTPLSGVTISGAAQVGGTLTASVAPTGATVAYQWQESSNGTNYTPINLATSNTYTPVSTDLGDYIKVVATGSGDYIGTVTSTATAQVATTSLSGVTISGAAQVGAQLTASVAPAGATVTYQWQESSNGTNYSSINLATSSTYTPVSGDQGDYIEVVVTGTGSYTGTVTSTPTAQVAATTPLSGVTISGTAQVGSTLTASVAPTGATVAYQWQESSNGTNYTPINLATSNTYTPVSTDRGDCIEVVATGSGSYTGMVTSAATAQVTALLSGVTISGTPQVGVKLTASVAPVGATATYQWQESYDGIHYSSINLATSSTYTPVSGDQGYCIEVVATGSGSYTGQVTSAATAQVAATTLLSGVTISGTPQVGSTLTASAAPAGATATYEWEESTTLGGSYSPITLSSTYTLVLSNAGYYIEVVAMGTGGYTGTVTSTPTAQVPPSLSGVTTSGTYQVGKTLTATVKPTGATATYQWQESSNGANYSSITGATSSTYTLVSANSGYYIEVVATGSGSYTGSKTSSAKWFAVLTGVTISGTAQVGSTLTASVAPAGATVAYQWQESSNGANYSSINLATPSTYTPVSGDQGYYIEVVASGSGSYAGSVTSAPTAQVAAAEIPLTGVTISGTPQVGDTLTASVAPAGATVTYQWQESSNGASYSFITGATASAYTPVSGDLGDYIEVVATGTGAYSGSETSTPTAQVAAAATIAIPINKAAIPGVTVPVTGETPVLAISDTGEYTETVSWNGSPSTFAPSTAYTATITITPGSGYTLTGVVQDFFTVAGATTVSNAADSGVVTALFPATAAPIAPIQTIAPTITTPIYATDTSVSGTAVPGASVSLTINGGTAQMATADKTTGAWTVNGLTLAEGDTISVTAILSPDTLSNPATATVAAAPVQTAYTVTYDGNGNDGGNVPTGSHTYAWGAIVTVLNNTGGLSKIGCTFAGWNTDRSGSGTPYAAGNVFSITSNAVTLYAQWEASNVATQSLLPPEISPVSGGSTGSQTVTISDPNPPSISVDDAVYYTLNNTMPTLQSCKCTRLPFTFALDQSAEVSAAVYNQVYGWSQPACVTYTLIIPTSVPYQTISTSVYAPPTTISFSNSESGNTVNLSNLLAAPSSNTTVPLPPLVIQSGTSPANAVVVSVYAGTTISAASNSNWSGSINAPTVQSINSVTVVPDQGDTATVDSVIEIGAGNTPLTFNQPVQILFPGQAGKHVGYYQNSVFTPILPMSPGSVADLGQGQSGYYDSGADLVVWTTHFTQYVIYTEASQTASTVAGGITSIPTPAPGATSLTSPTVPSGFTITIATSSNAGVIATNGTITPPAAATTVNLVFTVTDTSDDTTANTSSIAVIVPAAPINNTSGGGNREILLAIDTGSLPLATVGVPYSETIVTNNSGILPYIFSVASGSLPEGLTLAPGTGILNGTPTAAGQYSFSIAVKDAAGTTASRAYALIVNAAAENQPATLSDVTGNWAQGSIEKLVSLGYIAGYPDGTFKPGNQITRAEFCAIMDKVLDLTTAPAEAGTRQQTPTFTDVSTGDWFDQAVESAVYAGIAKGYGDGTFHPNAPISRQEIACVLVHALDESDLADSNARAVTKFLDDRDIAWWSRGFIFVALQQGIVSGYPDGSFKPENETTRAEACTMIANFLRAYSKK